MNILDRLRAEGKLGHPIGTRVKVILVQHPNLTVSFDGTIYDIWKNEPYYEIIKDNFTFFQMVPFNEVCKIQNAPLDLDVVERYKAIRLKLFSSCPCGSGQTYRGCCERKEIYDKTRTGIQT